MNIPVTVFMCICWSMLELWFFPHFWKVRGSLLAPTFREAYGHTPAWTRSPNLTVHTRVNTSGEGCKKKDEYCTEGEHTWPLPSRWGRQPGLIPVLCSAWSCHVFTPGSSHRPNTGKWGCLAALTIPLWSQCPMGCQPVRSVSSWPWWSRHDLDRIKGL